MKKFVSLLVLAALLLSSFIIPAFAEEPLLGVWYANVDHPTEIPQDVLDAFDAATENMTGCVYKPIALLGSQVVAGMNALRNDARRSGCSAELRAGLFLRRRQR